MAGAGDPQVRGEERLRRGLLPDGKALAVAGADRNVRLWDVAGEREVAALPHGNVVLSVAFSPDGKRVASGNGATEPFEVKLWEVTEATGRDPKQ